MITGFEEETAPLTEYEERELLPVMIDGLSKKIGKENAVTSSTIVRRLKEKGLKIDGARVRKLINHIRRHDLVPLLCGSSKGYWIEHNEEEINKYILSLHERIEAISAVRNAMIRQLDQIQNRKAS